MIINFNKIVLLFISITLIGCKTSNSFYEKYEDLTDENVSQISLLLEAMADTNNVLVVKEKYFPAQKDSIQIIALGNFYSGLLAMRIGNLEYADKVLSSASNCWPNNIEFWMLRALCLDLLGEDERVLKGLQDLKKQENLSAYTLTMIDVVENKDISKERINVLTRSQKDFVGILQQLSDTTTTNIYNIKYMDELDWMND